MKRLFANKKFSLHTWVAAAALTGGIIGSPANAIDLFIDHRGEVNSASFSPDGKRMVTASKDGTARVWDAGTGKPVGAPIPSLSASAQKDIRGVDFRNFTYEYGLGEPETITVRDGEFARETEDDPLYFSIVDVVYGDVTRDGQDDAVVRTVISGGGSGSFSDATIYTMRDGKPVAIGSLGVGDRANGGIHDVRIENGRIVVERYGQEDSGACCPEYIERNIIELQGTKFEAVAKTSVRGYQAFRNDEGPSPHRVKFLKSTSAITLAGSTNNNEAYVLGARKGQRVQLDFFSKDAMASATFNASGSKTLGTIRAGMPWSGTLPANGDYTISITSKAPSDSSGVYYSLNLLSEPPDTEPPAPLFAETPAPPVRQITFVIPPFPPEGAKQSFRTKIPLQQLFQDVAKNEATSFETGKDECYFSTMRVVANLQKSELLHAGMKQLSWSLINASLGLISTGSVLGDFLFDLGTATVGSIFVGTPLSETILTTVAENTMGYIIGQKVSDAVHPLLAPAVSSLGSITAKKLTTELTTLLNTIENNTNGVMFWGFAGNSATAIRLNKQDANAPFATVNARIAYNPWNHFTTAIIATTCQNQTTPAKHIYTITYEVRKTPIGGGAVQVGTVVNFNQSDL